MQYKATIDDPRVAEVRILRPQEIPQYVAEGLFDIGITGRDWVEETASEVESLGELQYSKATVEPGAHRRGRAAGLAGRAGRGPARRACGCRASTPSSPAGSSPTKGIDADIRLSYGATEAKVPDIVDCIVDITETGRALRAAGLKIIDTILVSYTELIANPAAYADPDKAHAMRQLRTLLEGVLEARGKVLVKLNVPADRLDGGDRAAAVDEGADGERALRRRGLRGRDGGREAPDQRADPGPVRRGRHRHHRAPDLQDRPLSVGAATESGVPLRARQGTVVEFDDPRGLGVVRADDGFDYPFHCTAIADGSRTITVGTGCRSVSSPAGWASGRQAEWPPPGAASTLGDHGPRAATAERGLHFAWEVVTLSG